MLNEDDKKFLVETFAMKKELVGVKVDVAILRKDVAEVKDSYSRMETKIDKVLNKLDKFTGNISTLEQENKFGAVILNRHDIQIHELATATGTAISE